MVETESYMIGVPLIIGLLLVLALGGPATVVDAFRPVAQALFDVARHLIR